MKKILPLLLIVFAFGRSMAQITDGKLAINKTEQPALVCDFAFNPEFVTSFLLEDLKDKGFGKGDEKKDVYKYTGILFTDISPDKIDFYFKVEQGDKKDPNASKVYILVSKGYDNFVSRTDEPLIFSAAGKYLEGLKLKMDAKKLEMDIDAQEEIIKMLEKKYDETVYAGKDLQEQKNKLEEAIKQNESSRNDIKSNLEKEKDLLKALKKKKR